MEKKKKADIKYWLIMSALILNGVAIIIQAIHYYSLTHKMFQALSLYQELLESHEHRIEILENDIFVETQ